MVPFVRSSLFKLFKTKFILSESKIVMPVSSIKKISTSNFKYIITEKAGEKQNVGLIKLNRPEVLNVLSDKMVTELSEAVLTCEANETIGAIIITGNEHIFTAGGDMTEMIDISFSSVLKVGILEHLFDVINCKKPVIGAVNGLCLGAGSELIMICDIIYAEERAKFGIPEVLFGTLPGGCSQRMAHICGKSLTMEACLSGNRITAQEALSRGLVSKVFPSEILLSEAIKLAEKISEHSPLTVAMCKESINYAYESSLNQGLQFEKNLCSEVLLQQIIKS